MWFKYAYTYDRNNRVIAVRWSGRRNAWVKIPRTKAEGLEHEGLAEFVGWL